MFFRLSARIPLFRGPPAWGFAFGGVDAVIAAGVFDSTSIFLLKLNTPVHSPRVDADRTRLRRTPRPLPQTRIPTLAAPERRRVRTQSLSTFHFNFSIESQHACPFTPNGRRLFAGPIILSAAPACCAYVSICAFVAICCCLLLFLGAACCCRWYMTCTLCCVVCMVYGVRAWYVRGNILRDVCGVLICVVCGMRGMCCLCKHM